MNANVTAIGENAEDSSTRHLSWSEALATINKVYEKTPWIAARLQPEKQTINFNTLKYELRRVVREASFEEQVELIKSFKTLATQEISYLITHDEGMDLSEELAKLESLQQVYEKTFGWPFLIFTKGTRHLGLSLQQCLDVLRSRIHNPMSIELQETLLQFHRVTEYQLSKRLGSPPQRGYNVWDHCKELSRNSEDTTSLTVTFLSPAHQAASSQLKAMFLDAGFDEVCIDAIGNVVGRYHGSKKEQSPYLLTGSHYDTVRNGGAFDGRIGIVIPMEFVKRLASREQRLPFGIELVAFSEEEGVRFPATFLGSSALVGDFQRDWLNLVDVHGVSLKSALSQAGLASCFEDIEALKRDPNCYLGFVEVHIEQGPVLYKRGLPLGVVTAINGSRRYKLKLLGQASHAGTTPMGERRDVACAAAEITLFVEMAGNKGINTVATVGVLQVFNGSINTVPGQCELSLDIRAPKDEDRDALTDAIFAEIGEICKRRQVSFESNEVLRVAAAPCDDQLRHLWIETIQDLGLEVFELPSGAGHDAMKIHEILPQAMLFVRGENNGISHNPLESTDSDDLQLAYEAFESFCLKLSKR